MKLLFVILLLLLMLLMPRPVWADCAERVVNSRLAIEDLLRESGAQLTRAQNERLVQVLRGLCDNRQPGDSFTVKKHDSGERRAFSTQGLNPKTQPEHSGQIAPVIVELDGVETEPY